VVLEIDEQMASIARDLIAGILHQENILVRRYFYPGCHRMEPYKSLFPDAGLYLAETEKLVNKTLLLPTGTAIGSKEITGICRLLKFIIDHGAEITNQENSQQVKRTF
jgi:dTDP-4-amino-4,6-dideoxygalactose transaminase